MTEEVVNEGNEMEVTEEEREAAIADLRESLQRLFPGDRDVLNALDDLMEEKSTPTLATQERYAQEQAELFQAAEAQAAKAVAALEAQRSAFLLKLPVEDHELLRIWASLLNTTMTELVVAGVQAELKQLWLDHPNLRAIVQQFPRESRRD